MIDTITKIGEMYTVLCCGLLLLVVLGMIIVRILNNTVPISKWIGECIMFLVFLIPAASMGAFAGKILAIFLPLSGVFVWVGLLIGIYGGIRLWDSFRG